MPWLKLDDKFADSPKVDGLSDAAARLWIMAACWCRKPENVRYEGFVPEAALATITRRRWPTEHVRELVRELVDATLGGTHKHGLWETCDGGWKFHDWEQFQPIDHGSVTDLARKAGLASAEARRKRDGTAVPKHARNRVTTEHVRNPFGTRSVGVRSDEFQKTPQIIIQNDRTRSVEITHEISEENRTPTEHVRSVATERTEPPIPIPNQKQSLKSYGQGKDLSESARPACDMSAPRQRDATELRSDPEQEKPSQTRLPDTQARVQTKPAQREPREPKVASEVKPVALPSRSTRVRTELSELPIGELAKRWRENPTWVAESNPQSRPELTEVALAWDTAVGLRPTPLGHPGRDTSTKALLELYADGVTKEAILRACEQAGRTGWICGREQDYRGQVRKRRIAVLSVGVLRDLLDAAPSAEVTGVSPAVAAMLAERKRAV